MPIDTLSTNERALSERAPKIEAIDRDEALRKLALRHLADVRRFKRYLFGYLLALVVLTPVWVVTQYETADGWPKHLSTRSRYPGDWDPWIIWVALVGAVVVAVAAYRMRSSRGFSEREVEAEIQRLKSRR